MIDGPGPPATTRATVVGPLVAVMRRSDTPRGGLRATHRILLECTRDGGADSGNPNSTAAIRPPDPTTWGTFGSGSEKPPRAHAGSTPRSTGAQLALPFPPPHAASPTTPTSAIRHTPQLHQRRRAGSVSGPLSNHALIRATLGRMDEPVRVDKWLWAARLVKTRALAVDAIRGGRVRVNGQPAKPSKDVKPGDRLEFSAGVLRMELDVRGTSERRVSAPEAARLYEETPESRATREARLEEMRMTRPQGVDRNARPTKRERRQLERLKGRREPR